MDRQDKETTGIMFDLDPRLDHDTEVITRLGLSLALLMNDVRFPWVILVPEKPGLCELHDLTAADRAVLMEEIAQAGAALAHLFAPQKINVGALGNIVGQLHVHVVARNAGDAAWPGPVWGCGEPVPYGAEALLAMKKKLGAALA
jgi:diadenosine tetraphosphate (Ap4A) HIT family hydrolase